VSERTKILCKLFATLVVAFILWGIQPDGPIIDIKLDGSRREFDRGFKSILSTLEDMLSEAC